MTAAIQAYITLIALGILLIGAEVFLPGGVLGVIGGLALFAAGFAGFAAFGPNGGLASALAIVVFSGICIGIWVKYFPHTPMGRRLTLSKSGGDFKSYSPENSQLVGKEGIAVSTLRPSGIAKIDGKRVDVVTDDEWIEEGKPIRVIQVEGFRVVVREIESGSKDPA